jgi:hypothetical protein
MDGMKSKAGDGKNGHIPSNGKSLSLWPLSVEEAVGAILQVPPPPKPEKKAPPKRGRPSRKVKPPTDG